MFGKKGNLNPAMLIGILIFVLVAVNLVDPISTAVAGVNTTTLGTGGTALLGLVNIVFMAGIVLAIFYGFKLKQ